MFRLQHLKIQFPGGLGYGGIAVDGGMVEFFHYGAAYAAAHTGRHFYKAVMQRAGLDLPQGSHAVFHPVHGHIGIPGIFVRQGFQHPARGGKEPGPGMFQRMLGLLQFDPLGLEPGGELIKSQHGIHKPFAALGFVFFGHTRADKHGFCLGNASLYILAVRLHGGKHVRQIGQHIRKILLDEKVHTVAAGGN